MFLEVLGCLAAAVDLAVGTSSAAAASGVTAEALLQQVELLPLLLDCLAPGKRESRGMAWKGRSCAGDMLVCGCVLMLLNWTATKEEGMRGVGRGSGQGQDNQRWWVWDSICFS